jgi:hypothetical protein
MATAYHIHCPGWAFSCIAYGNSIRDCLDKFKKQNDLSRMPKGYAIWKDESVPFKSTLPVGQRHHELS